MELTNEFKVAVPVAQAWAVLTDVERIAPCLPGAQLQEIEGDEYRGIVKIKVGPITAQYKGKATFVSKDDTGHVAVLLAEGRDTRGQGNASATITARLTEEGGQTTVNVMTDLTITGKVAQFGRGVLVDVSGKLLTQFVGCLEHDLLSAPAMAASGSAEATAAPGSPPPGTAKTGTAGSGETDPAADAAEVGDVDPAAAGMIDALDQSLVDEIDEVDAAAGDESAGPAGQTVASPDGPAWGGPAVAVDEPIPGATRSATTAGPAGAPTVRKIEHAASAPVNLLDAAGVPVAKRAIPGVAAILVILWFLRRRRRQS